MESTLIISSRHCDGRIDVIHNPIKVSELPTTKLIQARESYLKQAASTPTNLADKLFNRVNGGL
jgi:hypothetical protein